MKMRVVVFLAFILGLTSSDDLTMRFAHFQMIFGYEFEKTNFCYPAGDSFQVVANQRDCSMICLKSRSCRTASFDRLFGHCKLFPERIDEGQLTQKSSAVVISLRQWSNSKKFYDERSTMIQLTSDSDEIVVLINTTAGEDGNIHQQSQYSLIISDSPSDSFETLKSKRVGPSWKKNRSNIDGFYVITKHFAILTHLCWIHDDDKIHKHHYPKTGTFIEHKKLSLSIEFISNFSFNRRK